MSKNSRGQYEVKKVVKYDGHTKRISGISQVSKAMALEAFEHNKKKWIDSLKIQTEANLRPFDQGIRTWYKTFLSQKGRRNMKRSEDTIRTDKETIDALCTHFKDQVVASITAEQIQNYFNKLKEDRSDSVIKKRWNMLKMYYAYCIPGPNSAFAKCFKPVSDKQSVEKKAYSDDEIERLVGEFQTEYQPGTKIGYLYGDALTVILYQFMRLGELLELRAKDVNLDESYIHIERQYNVYTRQVTPPKYNSDRYMPILKESRQIIEYYMTGKDPEDLVFTSDSRVHRSRIPANILRRNLLRAQIQAGLIEDEQDPARHTVHDLRHDGISRLVRKLGSTGTADISQWSGHKNISTTLDKYYRDTGFQKTDAFNSVT